VYTPAPQHNNCTKPSGGWRLRQTTRAGKASATDSTTNAAPGAELSTAYAWSTRLGRSLNHSGCCQPGDACLYGHMTCTPSEGTWPRAAGAAKARHNAAGKAEVTHSCCGERPCHAVPVVLAYLYVASAEKGIWGLRLHCTGGPEAFLGAKAPSGRSISTDYC